MRKSLIFFVLVVFFSCQNIIYEKYHSFDQEVWNSDSLIVFEHIVLDTLNPHNLTLSIRHLIDYEYQNLFLFLEAESKDTIEITLANKNGKWHGGGITDVREFNYVVQKNKIFKNKGVYTLKVEQAMRYGAEQKIQKLDNISAIGLTISESNE